VTGVQTCALPIPYEVSSEGDPSEAGPDADAPVDDESEPTFGSPRAEADPAVEQLKRYLEKLRPEDFGKFRL